MAVDAPQAEFKPYIPPEKSIPELTFKSITIGALFGIIFGAATVYLALKAGLTVSASIPIAVLSITILKWLGGSTILENNVVQTIGSAGESIAAGVVFTLPGFLFLAAGPDGKSIGEPFFASYWTITILAMLGGILGTLMMIPLRRSLIVKEHGTLPYPEGTACASVLIAGEKGGPLALIAYLGVGFALLYAFLQKILHVIAETPAYVTNKASKIFPSATITGEITPEYMGVGYIIGPRIAGVLVAGGVLAWLGLIPLLATLVPPEVIQAQQEKLGYFLTSPTGKGGWDAASKTFANPAVAIYFAYVRQIGAGAVAAGGFITLLKTLPTIVSSFKDSLASLREGSGPQSQKRTERDLPITVVLFGSAALILIMAALPFIPGTGFFSKLLLGLMIVIFGFFFVTVASRIVGIIGSSSNPISGMTIATLMATCLIFIGIQWTGDIYQPMALCVGGMVCIAAANAGATSQDLKTGYLVGATPRAQQIGLIIGAMVSSLVIGLTVQALDKPSPDLLEKVPGMVHAIGSEKFPAPQGTLMATLIKGLLGLNLDWQFVLVGVFIAITMELCGIKALSFAVGLYLPLSTTAPIFAGGAIKGFADWMSKRKGEAAEESEIGPGNLYATGLVAGGALAGVAIAILMGGFDSVARVIQGWSLEHGITGAIGDGGYQILGVLAFAFMGFTLYRMARRKMGHG
jgi:putative OPT family oligopeptide transporter